jgi:TonB family protein
MVRNFLLTFFLAAVFATDAQTSSTDPMYQGHLTTGKDDFDQILQTQLTIPKSLLNSNLDRVVTCYFNLDEEGNPVKVKFEEAVNNLLRPELLRMFRFFHFRHTLNLPNEERPYFVQFNISSEEYKKYIKQKYRHTIKKPLLADSSYRINTRADAVPAYYKNGEEGLNEYILTEIEYPKVARERSIQGTVVLEFIVETNGYITGITVKQGVNGGCTEEAIRIMKTTRWNPAVVDGKLVRYKTTFPITFTIPVNRNAGGAVNGM